MEELTGYISDLEIEVANLQKRQQSGCEVLFEIVRYFWANQGIVWCVETLKFIKIGVWNTMYTQSHFLQSIPNYEFCSVFSMLSSKLLKFWNTLHHQLSWKRSVLELFESWLPRLSIRLIRIPLTALRLTLWLMWYTLYRGEPMAYSFHDVLFVQNITSEELIVQYLYVS